MNIKSSLLLRQFPLTHVYFRCVIFITKGENLLTQIEVEGRRSWMERGRGPRSTSWKLARQAGDRACTKLVIYLCNVQLDI